MEARKWAQLVMWVVGLMMLVLGGHSFGATGDSGAIIYVNASAAGANSGTSWSDAYTGLQSALEVAVAGDEIWVAAGTYKPTAEVGGTGQRYRTFQLKNVVGVYGGFNGTETDRSQRDWDVNKTICSGDLNGNGAIDSQDAYHVFYHYYFNDYIKLNATAVLDGCVITGGNADGSIGHTNSGGGIYNYHSSPTIIHCTFTNNSAVSSGGGMYNYYSDPTVTYCTFSNNVVPYTSSSSSRSGGGMCNSYSNPTLDHCIFIGNSAYSWGGGIYNEGSGLISNCVFIGNTVSAGNGGGIYNNYSFSKLSNCVFIDNSASVSYGGLGGGIHNVYSFISLDHCTLAGNSASQGGGIFGLVKASYCIIWGNTARTSPQIRYNYSTTSPASPVLAYCDIQGGGFSGTGLIDVVPKFVRNPSAGADGKWGTADDDYGDLRLQSSSPCIDIGINDDVSIDNVTDLDGNSRILDGNDDGKAIVDLGAYEYTVPQDTVHPVYFAPAAGVCYNEQTVILTSATPDAVIHYTTNGQEPTECDPALASGQGVFIEQNGTLKAGAWKAGMTPSEIQTAAYQFTTAAPEFTPDEGGYLTEQTVRISCKTAGAVIRYTTDGSDPAAGTIIDNGGTITITPMTTLKAVAYTDKYLISAVKTAVYSPAKRIYVNASATGVNTGTSWTDAFTSLQSALDAAVTYDEIWVAAGTYKPTKEVDGTGDRYKTFQLKNGVAVYGGFIGTESSRDQRNWELNNTIFSGDLNDNGKDDNDVYHVFYHPSALALDATAVLDGCIITWGNANGTSPHNYGGGMYNDGCIPTVIHCTFSSNIGSGIYMGTGLLRNSRYVYTPITDCTFKNNDNGIYNAPTVTRCNFTNNSGTGIYNSGRYGSTISYCTFTGSTGQGISNYHWANGVEVAHCLFDGVINGITNDFQCSVTVKYCSFKNISISAIKNTFNSILEVRNCTFNNGITFGINNSGSPCFIEGCTFSNNLNGGIRNINSSNGTSYPCSLSHCVLWGDTASGCKQVSDQSQSISGFIAVSFCDVQGGWTGRGTSNMDADPLFVDAARGDLRLQAGSPCIDAGNPEVTAYTLSDLASSPRVMDGNCDGKAVVDMGAYEYYLPGDLNTSCSVDVDDLSLFSPHWLQTDCVAGENCTGADIDRSGEVTMADFALLAGHWLEGIE